MPRPLPSTGDCDCSNQVLPPNVRNRSTLQLPNNRLDMRSPPKYVTIPNQPYREPCACGNVSAESEGKVAQLLVSRAGSNGRCNTIWYKAVFKGGVYEARETVWAFSGAEERRVASLEGRADAA